MTTFSPRRVLLVKIQKKLADLNLRQLQTVASSIDDGREADYVVNLNELELYDLIVDYIRSEELKAAEDEGMTQLLLLFDLLNDVLSAPGTEAAEPGNVATVMTQDSATQNRGEAGTTPIPIDSDTHTQPFHMDRDTNTQSLHMDREPRVHVSFQGRDTVDVLNREVTSSTSGMPGHSGVAPLGRMNSSNTSDQVVRLSDVSALLPRREFKLHGGQICDAGCDMSFNCLCKQMDEGLQEGFSGSEIIRAVLKITKPGTFREMLVNKNDLTVNELKRFLRSHIRDKSVTELFQELTNAKQSDKESPQQFLYRIMGLKQRILFESQHPGVGFSYSQELVQGTFVHTLYQGLSEKNSHVRHDLKPLLSDMQVSDDLLLEQITKSTAEEEGRLKRLGSGGKTRSATVSAAQHSQSELNTPTRVDTELQANRDAIKELTAQVSSLTKHLAQMSTPAETVKLQDCRSPTVRAQPPLSETRDKCNDCVKNNNMNCVHCFVCGQAGHRAIGCLQRRLSENGKRSLERGSQRS
ncbi:uncharacterized protein LOC120464220 [Pimephales promelas]|uniref:uncharacterized protein LOC120464220 n=1 Tax=Pimephales promelas TaxID=90988 RepID=UPI001955CE37|nr:uncharacterized protein LOC120464220 [Pimephales promelas]